MASVIGAFMTLSTVSCSHRQNQARKISGLSSVSLPIHKLRAQSITLRSSPSRVQVSCMAKQETVDKVCEIVKKQLALPDGSSVTGESKFASLGADSLDTVEIVMGLEEEFGVSVEEETAQKIQTVQDAADLIETLREKGGLKTGQSEE